MYFGTFFNLYNELFIFVRGGGKNQFLDIYFRIY